MNNKSLRNLQQLLGGEEMEHIRKSRTDIWILQDVNSDKKLKQQRKMRTKNNRNITHDKFEAAIKWREQMKHMRKLKTKI